VLARRIDKTPQFIASAVSSFAVEGIGAVFSARAAEFDQNTARAFLRGMASSVYPSEQGTGPNFNKEAPAASREIAHGEAKAAAPSPARRSEAAVPKKLLFAVKVAHEELGEKAALFLGCAVAARVGGLSSEWAVKTLALLLLEAVSDLAKTGAYAARKIDVGHVRFNFHWPSLLGVALVGGGSCGVLFAAIGFNCLIGDNNASIFG
jgi:hypothetical protein